MFLHSGHAGHHASGHKHLSWTEHGPGWLFTALPCAGLLPLLRLRWELGRNTVSACATGLLEPACPKCSGCRGLPVRVHACAQLIGVCHFGCCTRSLQAPAMQATLTAT